MVKSMPNSPAMAANSEPEAFGGLLVEPVETNVAAALGERGAQVELAADVVVELLVLHDVEAAVARNVVMARTMPGRSGQARVRTKSAVRALALAPAAGAPSRTVDKIFS
jgi:hypothetical protein